MSAAHRSVLRLTIVACERTRAVWGRGVEGGSGIARLVLLPRKRGGWCGAAHRGRGVRRPRRATRRAGGAGRRRVERTRDARCVAGGRGRSRRGRAGARRRRPRADPSGNTPRSTELRHGDRRGRSGGHRARREGGTARRARAHPRSVEGRSCAVANNRRGNVRVRAARAFEWRARRGAGWERSHRRASTKRGVGKIQTGWLRGASANARVGGTTGREPWTKTRDAERAPGAIEARDPRVINPSGFPEPVAAPEIRNPPFDPNGRATTRTLVHRSIALGRVDGARARAARASTARTIRARGYRSWGSGRRAPSGDARAGAPRRPRRAFPSRRGGRVGPGPTPRGGVGRGRRQRTARLRTGRGRAFTPVREPQEKKVANRVFYRDCSLCVLASLEGSDFVRTRDNTRAVSLARRFCSLYEENRVTSFSTFRLFAHTGSRAPRTLRPPLRATRVHRVHVFRV